MAIIESSATLNRDFIGAGSGRLDKIVLAQIVLVISAASLYPLYLGNLHFGSWPVSLLTLMAPAVLVVEVTYFVSRFCQMGRAPIPTFLDAAILSFFIYFLFRNIASPEGLATVKYVIYGIGLFYMVTLFASDEKKLDPLIFFITGLTGITALYGLVEYSLQQNFIYAGMIPESAKGLHRAGSTLVHPVLYGAFLVQTLPFCVLLLLKSNNLKKISFNMTVIVWGVTALLLTYSKGSWLSALFLAVALFLVIVKKRKREMLLTAMSFFAVIVISVIAFSNQIFSEFAWRNTYSYDTRLLVWKWTLNGIRDNFFFGVGLRQGPAELINYGAAIWYQYVSTDPPPIDNFFLGLTMENGVISLVLFVLILFLLFKNGIEALRADVFSNPLLLAALASLTGITLNMFTFAALYNWSNFIFFWIAAGIVHATAKNHVRGQHV